MLPKLQHISPFQRNIFFMTFIAMFIVVSLQHLGVQPMRLIRPVPQEVEVFEKIKPKLQQQTNTFHLKKNTSLIGQAHASGEYDAANSYAVIDTENGNVILEKSLSKRVPIASLTKIMTAIVALDLAEPSEYFIVSRKAARQIPTKIGVVAGEEMNTTELINALMLTSANDAAQVLSDGIDRKYGEAVFIRAMNEKANYIGLRNTHFINPQGFDGTDHYSSAEDLAILTAYAMTQYPLLAHIVSQDYAFIPGDVHHKQFDLYNWNGLLGVYPNVSGVKIGSTDEAGKTTVVVSERGGKKLMAVLLGAPGILERDGWTAQLLDEGFSQTLGLSPVRITEEQLREKYSTWKYW
jgi:serine-type D-Ala-D-Ala carboxypeptidase (penicillin-binding protein 5/6)